MSGKIDLSVCSIGILAPWAREVAAAIGGLQSEIEALKEQVSKLEITNKQVETQLQAKVLYTCTVCGYLCDPEKEEIWRHTTGMQHVRCVDREEGL